MPHAALSDCERVRWFGQPINTLTSMVMAGVGLALTRKHRRHPNRPHTARSVGAALAGAGIGSAAYHGPGGPIGHWLHDVLLLAPPAALAIESEAHVRGHSPRTGVIATGVAVAVFAAARTKSARIQDLLSTIVTVGIMGSTLHRLVVDPDVDPPTLALGAALGAAGATVYGMSRTGGPWCRPDSLLQGHGAWHLLMTGATVATAHGLRLVEARWMPVHPPAVGR